MKYIKLFEQFGLILEDIEGLDKIPAGLENELTRALSDKDSIKSCLETVFPNQSLKYLAAGGIGLTFQWLENSLDLSDDFYKTGFIGKKCDNRNKCIKVTMSDTEANQIKARVGKHDKGICEYFWVKETTWENKKIYLICMDFLDMPTVEQKMIIHLIFIISFPENYLHDKIDDKLKRIFDWLKSGNPEYSEEEFDKNFKEKFIIKMQKGLKIDNLVSMFCNRNKNAGREDEIKKYWKNMNEDFFMKLSKNVLEIFKTAENQGLMTGDIHENNMGYRKDELVAYDFI